MKSKTLNAMKSSITNLQSSHTEVQLLSNHIPTPYWVDVEYEVVVMGKGPEIKGTYKKMLFFKIVSY